MIVKVQIPLNHDEPIILVYNQKRTFLQELHAPEVVALLKSKGLVKAFFTAALDNAKLHLNRQVKDKDW